MNKTFLKTYLEHEGKVTDKWSIYIDEWDQLLIPYCDQQIRLLEIGIQNGGSLEIWGEYFSNAKEIVGCDIDQKCECLHYNDDRIAVIIGDANSDKAESQILQLSPVFDIIIDDGSHISSDIVRSFARYFPHLSDGGLYMVEDLHTSYWKDYEGGLHNPLSAMSFFKRLADVINYEHWRNNEARESLLAKFKENLGITFEEAELSRIHSIEFVNSICIIKKLPPDKNELGKRKIVGTDECVSIGIKKYDNTMIEDIMVAIGNDENLDVFSLLNDRKILSATAIEKDQAIKVLTATVTEKDQVIQGLTATVTEKYQVIQNLTSELSQTKAEQDQIIQNLTSELSQTKAEQDQIIQNLTGELSQTQAEVLKYALSRSWRLTRPLRKLKKLISGDKNA